MVAAELLKILRCPETRQEVRLAEPELLAQVNAGIAAGTVHNRNGQRVQAPVEAGLVRADGRFLYPVRGGVPVMLVEEALPLPLEPQFR